MKDRCRYLVPVAKCLAVLPPICFIVCIELTTRIVVGQEHYADVHHEIDCTRIAMNPKFKGLEAGSLDKIAPLESPFD